MADKKQVTDSTSKVQGIVGLSLIGSVGVGVLGVIICLVAVVNEQWVASGISLIASAISFGLCVHGVLQK